MSLGKNLSLVVFCILLSYQAAAENRVCSFLFSKPASVSHLQLSDTFSLKFFSEEVYKPLYCDRNVLRLYNGFNEKFDSLHEKDFNVYLITTKYWVKYSDIEVKFIGSNQRRIDDPEFTPGWNYHVVLEYKGVIYDLDFTNSPRPMPIKEYFKSFFVDQKVVTRSEGLFIGDHKEILVYKVPGNFYLKENQHIIGTSEMHYLIFKKFKAKTVEKYL